MFKLVGHSRRARAERCDPANPKHFPNPPDDKRQDGQGQDSSSTGSGGAEHASPLWPVWEGLMQEQCLSDWQRLHDNATLKSPGILSVTLEKQENAEDMKLEDEFRQETQSDPAVKRGTLEYSIWKVLSQEQCLPDRQRLYRATFDSVRELSTILQEQVDAADKLEEDLQNGLEVTPAVIGRNSRVNHSCFIG